MVRVARFGWEEGDAFDLPGWRDPFADLDEFEFWEEELPGLKRRGEKRRETHPCHLASAEDHDSLPPLRSRRAEREIQK